MTASSPRKLRAEHGVACRLPGERFSYFGRPTVARLDDGTLLVASSGQRVAFSRDDGMTWEHDWIVPQRHDTQKRASYIRNPKPEIRRKHEIRNRKSVNEAVLLPVPGLVCRFPNSSFLSFLRISISDLGCGRQPALGDGSLFTVCYQKAAAGEKCSPLWSRWRLPDMER